MRSILACVALSITLTGCSSVDIAPPQVTDIKTPNGLQAMYMHLPDAKEVTIRAAWPMPWSYTEGRNPATPYIGTTLLNQGGGSGIPPAEIMDRFAELGANVHLDSSVDMLQGVLQVEKQSLMDAIALSRAVMDSPDFDADMQARMLNTLIASIEEMRQHPAISVIETLVHAVFDNPSFETAFMQNDQATLEAVSHQDIKTWYAQTLVANGLNIAIAGPVTAAEASAAIDALFADLPKGGDSSTNSPESDFRAQTILLHLPEAEKSSLTLVGQIPPTRDGQVFEDMIATAILGGNERSLLFQALRNELRASYAIKANTVPLTRDLRIISMSGEVETGQIDTAHALILQTYGDFYQNAPASAAVDSWKAVFRENLRKNSRNTSIQARVMLEGQMDGYSAANWPDIPAMLQDVSPESILNRVQTHYPRPDELMVIAVSPDANALPGACVISKPIQVKDCL